jgi:hypothetical protein
MPRVLPGAEQSPLDLGSALTGLDPGVNQFPVMPGLRMVDAVHLRNGGMEKMVENRFRPPSPRRCC